MTGEQEQGEGAEGKTAKDGVAYIFYVIGRRRDSCSVDNMEGVILAVVMVVLVVVMVATTVEVLLVLVLEKQPLKCY